MVFTSGGTEADNLAVKGIFWARRAADERRDRILCPAVEHHAVLDPVEWLGEHDGADVDWLPVDPTGRVDLAELAAARRAGPGRGRAGDRDVGEQRGRHRPAGRGARRRSPAGTASRCTPTPSRPSAPCPVDFAASGVDALTLTGHKLGGPYGVGALLVRRDLTLTPLLHGGGQERDVRSGTLDVPAIAAFATAVELAVKRQAEHAERVAALRDDLVERVLALVPDARLNGDPVDRLPGNAHLTFPGCEGDSLLMLLDARGIECSTGSACSAGVPQPSHVLLAMGRDETEARGSLRFSLGHTSTAADVDALLEAIGPVVARARTARR